MKNTNIENASNGNANSGEHSNGAKILSNKEIEKMLEIVDDEYYCDGSSRYLSPRYTNKEASRSYMLARKYEQLFKLHLTKAELEEMGLSVTVTISKRDDDEVEG